MKAGLETLTPAEVRKVAQTLGVKPEEVVEMETRLGGRDLTLEPADDDETGYAPIAYLADPGAEPSQLVEAKQDDRLRSEGLENALAALDPRSRRIIEARWLKEKDTATLHDLADEFKVSAERIRQIEVKALQKMKGVLSPA